MKPLVLLALSLTACAAPQKVSLADLTSVAHLSSLPSGAQVIESGQPLGHTPLDLPLRAGQTYTLTLALPGFTSQLVSGDRAKLLGTNSGQLGLVLVPSGYKPPGRLSLDDPRGLTALAGEVERRKDWGHAAEIWARVLVLRPRSPRAHKGMGSALAKLGRDEEAIRQYEQYLFLEPDAPDAARVQRVIDAYRGGLDVRSGLEP